MNNADYNGNCTGTAAGMYLFGMLLVKEYTSTSEKAKFYCVTVMLTVSTSI